MRKRIMNVTRLLEANVELEHSCETLMSSLRLLGGERPLKSLLVTSAQPEEGKTTIAACLSLRTSAAGTRTVLVDADLRRPAVHQVFGLPNTTGLVEIVAGDVPVSGAIQEVDVLALTNERAHPLGVVTSGQYQHKAFSVIQSPSFATTIRGLADTYQAVFVDAPPVLSVNDALMLAPLVDGVVLVLDAGLTSKRDAESAKQRLEQAGGTVLGAIMNRFDERLHGPDVHPYHAYYEEPPSK